MRLLRFAQPSFQELVVPVGSWVAGGRVKVRRSHECVAGGGGWLGDAIVLVGTVAVGVDGEEAGDATMLMRWSASSETKAC